MNSRIAVLVAAGLLSACSARPASYPVTERGEIDLKALDGEWAGTYKTTTGRIRTGKLQFVLRGTRDVASGNVVFTYLAEPATTEPWLYAAPPIESEPMAISFTRVGTRVSGKLESVLDPYCACEFRTVFAGRVRGDRIEGTFTMQHLVTNAITWGEWKAARLPPKVVVE